jgi:hypothetical protein
MAFSRTTVAVTGTPHGPYAADVTVAVSQKPRGSRNAMRRYSSRTRCLVMPARSIQKNGRHLACELRDDGEAGVEVLMSRDGDLLYGRRYATSALALEEADEQKAGISARAVCSSRSQRLPTSRRFERNSFKWPRVEMVWEPSSKPCSMPSGVTSSRCTKDGTSTGRCTPILRSV